MDTKKQNKDQIIASLRKMNRELIEENEHLRKQIIALEELAIDTKTGYNWSMIESEFMEENLNE
jgi:hypothetical protein